MPKRPIELHPEAISEAQAAYAWYEARNPVAAAEFMAELDEAIDNITDYPEKWASHSYGTRRYLLKRFPYLVVYREGAVVTEVIAIAHGHRRPGFWRSRMSNGKET